MALSDEDLKDHLLYHIIRQYGRLVGTTWLLDVADAGFVPPFKLTGEIVGDGLVLKLQYTQREDREVQIDCEC